MIVNFIFALLTLISIFLIIYFYTNKSVEEIKKPVTESPTESPSIPIDFKEAGFFLTDEEDLFYKYGGDQYLDAGKCNDCISACKIASPIENVYTSINCDDEKYKSKEECKGVSGYKVVKLFSKNQYKDLIKSKVKGQKTLNVDECIRLVNASNPQSQPVSKEDEQREQVIKDMLNKGVKSLTDFFTKNKEQLVVMSVQIGMAVAISLFAKNYSSAAFIVPMLLQGEYYSAGVNVAFEITQKMTEKILKRTTKKLAEMGLKKSVKGVQGKAMSKVVNRVSSQIAKRVAQEVAEKIIAKMLLKLVQMAAKFMTAVFNVVDWLQMIGMVLDMIDPCGLNNQLNQGDVNSIADAFDNGFYQQLMSVKGYFPVLFTADMVPDYKFYCNPNKSSDKMMLSNFSLASATSGVDPCDIYDEFTTDAVEEYLDSLKVNQFGLCIGTTDDQELANHINMLTGASPGSKLYVTQETIQQSKDDFLNSEKFENYYDKFFDVFDMLTTDLTNDNLYVAIGVRKYWYIVLLVLFIIILIVFLIK